jgi:tRNA1(Val) A37 N6-methylase TrmN6
MVSSPVQRVYQAYYTKSDPLIAYMMRMLAVGEGMRVLEPCAGDGVFIDALLAESPTVPIDAFELNREATQVLKQKYRELSNVVVTCADTLTHAGLRIAANFGGIYDRIIANPPYGAWQDYDHRKLLKKIYPDLYIKETYSLFLYLSTKLLRDQGVLVFIVPDTWLNLHRHTNLRRYLLRYTKILEISLFPSSFFPNVNFGYANLCIVTLQKSLNTEECLNNRFVVVTGFKKPEQLVAHEEAIATYHEFSQSSVLKNIDSALFVSSDEKIRISINQAEQRIGDIADCVTGFYSGNDKKYLRTTSNDIKNAKKYLKVPPELICQRYLDRSDILEGIDGKACFVPIVKGGNVKYLKPDTWYIDWSIEAVKSYKSDAKARFQNPRFYFKTGIGVPMVSSSQVTASLIEDKIFDQSIVGIFPRESQLVYFLLAFFNSPTCNRLIRTINPSANNPANYIKKVPFIKPSEPLLTRISNLVQNMLTELGGKGHYDPSCECEINSLFAELYQL